MRRCTDSAVIRHGPHRKWHIQQFLFYCMYFYIWNLLTEPMPCSDRRDKNTGLQTVGSNLLIMPLRLALLPWYMHAIAWNLLWTFSRYWGGGIQRQEGDIIHLFKERKLKEYRCLYVFYFKIDADVRTCLLELLDLCTFVLCWFVSDSLRTDMKKQRELSSWNCLMRKNWSLVVYLEFWCCRLFHHYHFWWLIFILLRWELMRYAKGEFLFAT
jgi:hypothetical protein